tara:strand:+ start:741 stop:917 length:177 start_codon:yes stop_codon:yes gene_type:complete
MKFEDAVKKSIKSFMNGKMPNSATEFTEGGAFHTPEYFDDLEERLLGDDKKEAVNEDV